jgi:D-arabinose 1-dehydrogenase-like Zn-dependent alcohol dehydrogenase
MLLADAADAAEQIDAFTDQAGAACVFECVGTAETMRRAANYAARGGQIVVIGEEAEFPAIDTIQIAQRELRIVGARNGSRQDAADALGLMAAGTIRPPIVHRARLDDINDALGMLRDGQLPGRIVVTIS